MADYYGLETFVRLQYIDNLKRLIANLRPNECRALRQVLERNGCIPWTEFDAAFGSDLEESLGE
jgi:hypothetical protein